MLAGLLIIACFCFIAIGLGIFATLNVLKYEHIFGVVRTLLDDHEKLNTKINSLNGRLNRTGRADQMESLVAQIIAKNLGIDGEPQPQDELEFED